MLKKRLTAIGSLLISLLMLSLGTNVEDGQEAYFFPNLIAYILIGFSIVLLITEGELLEWLKEIKHDLSVFIFSESSSAEMAKQEKRSSPASRYSTLYFSLHKSVSSADQEDGKGSKRLREEFFYLTPMLIIILCYLNFAESIGLYVTSFVAFLLITITYTTKRPRNQILLKTLSIAVIFMGVIYLVFAVLLKLQTPSAWLL